MVALPRLRRWHTRVTGSLAALAATLTLGACSSSHDGYLAVAMDKAGRLLAVVAICGDNHLATLTLTDQTTGTSTTSKVSVPLDFGGSLILTPPIDNPRPEGALDLLERSHQYTLSGVVHDADNEEVGPTTSIRFVLDTVVKAKDLRAGSVLAASADGEDQSGAQMKKEDFVARARGECG